MNTDVLRDTWLMFQREYQCSVDRMLCDPALRAEFLASATASTACQNEQDLLWTLVALRKKKTLPSVLK